MKTLTLTKTRVVDQFLEGRGLRLFDFTTSYSKLNFLLNLFKFSGYFDKELLKKR